MPQNTIYYSAEANAKHCHNVCPGSGRRRRAAVGGVIVGVPVAKAWHSYIVVVRPVCRSKAQQCGCLAVNSNKAHAYTRTHSHTQPYIRAAVSIHKQTQAHAITTAIVAAVVLFITHTHCTTPQPKTIQCAAWRQEKEGKRERGGCKRGREYGRTKQAVCYPWVLSFRQHFEERQCSAW